MPEIAEPKKPAFRQELAEALKPFEAELAAKTGKTPAPDPKPPEPPKPPVETRKPAADAPPADPDKDLDEGKRSPKAEDWKRIKAIAGEFKTKAEQAEAKHAEVLKKLEAAEKHPKHNAELIKQLEADRDKYKSMFDEVAVEFAPEFNAKYQARIGAVMDGLKANLPVEVIDKVAVLLQMPDGQAKRERLTEITAELDDFQKTEIGIANREMRSILAARQGEIAKANETLGKIAADRKAKMEQRAAELSKSFDDTLARVKDSKDGIAIYQPKEGDETWNKAVAEREQVARAIFEDKFSNPAEKAEAALWGAAAPEFLNQLKTAMQTIADRDGTIAKMQGSNPGIGAAASGGGTSNAKTLKELMAEDLGR